MKPKRDQFARMIVSQRERGGVTVFASHTGGENCVLGKAFEPEYESM